MITDESIFIYIIGNAPGILSSSSDKTFEISGYSQLTSAILVHDLASKISNFSHRIHTFTYGIDQKYDIQRFTNNKGYFQLDSNHCFELDMKERADIRYCKDFDVILNEIETVLSPKKADVVLIMLDGHGVFTPKVYISLYKLIMKHSTYKYLILNDSSNGGSMIELIQIYNRIYQVLQLKSSLVDTYTIAALNSLVAKDLALFPEGTDQNKIFTAVSDIIDFFAKVNIEDENTLKAILQIAETHTDDKDGIAKPIEAQEAEVIKAGFSTVQDALNFKLVMDSLIPVSEILDINTYNKCKIVFTQANFEIYKEITRFPEFNIVAFYEIMDAICSKKMNVDFSLPPHPNIEVVTSTDMFNESLTFSSIRANEVIKLYPGSLGTSAFIKEIFMKLNGEAFEFANIVEWISINQNGSLQFPGRVKQEKGNHKKREWVHLNPQHLKVGNYSFKFEPSEIFLKDIQTLRILTFTLSKRLTEIAAEIAPGYKLDSATNDQDLLGDIVSLIAIAKSSQEGTKLDTSEIHQNIKQALLVSRNPLQLELIASMVLTTLENSKDPIKMASIAFSNLQEAVKQVSAEKDKAIINVMPKKAILAAFIIASKQLKEGNIANIIASMRISLDDPAPSRQFMKKIRDIEDDEKAISYAERCLLAFAQSGLEYVNKVCRVYGFRDFARLIHNYMKKRSGLRTLCSIINRASSDEKKAIEEIMLRAAENACNTVGLPPCFQLAIIGGMSHTTPLKALIIALYELEKSRLKNDKQNPLEFITRALEIIKSRKKNREILLNLFNQFIGGITFDKAKINEMKREIFDEANELPEKVKSIYNMFEKNALINIEKGVAIDLKEEISHIENEINKMKELISKSSPYILDLIDDICNCCEKREFKYKEPAAIPEDVFVKPVSCDLKEITERAAKELLSVADIMDILDSPIKSILEKDIEEYSIDKTMLLTRVISARACNVVEMRPIAAEMSYMRRVKKMPQMPINVNEIMALVTGTKHYLGPRDRERVRFRYHDGNLQTESDEYYSPGYFEDPDGPIVRTVQSPPGSPEPSEASSDFTSPSSSTSSPEMGKNKSFISLPKTLPLPFQCGEESEWEEELEYYEYYEDYDDYDDSFENPNFESYGGFADYHAATKLNVGKSYWQLDAWSVFVYRFNKRVKHLGIKFDPNKEYDGQTAYLHDTLVKVFKFFPANQIWHFQRLFSNFSRFVNQNRQHFSTIKEEIVKAFDDTDQTVTQFYFDTFTMQRG